ncbi:hypothetical protein niasHS_013496 [Heterodera schachtii]|uniref:BEN domain-containing protein n=1 Tax=Heterodera schachtii TaxID=97005 RepID=A0ABD2IFR8_HETSC
MQQQRQTLAHPNGRVATAIYRTALDVVQNISRILDSTANTATSQQQYNIVPGDCVVASVQNSNFACTSIAPNLFSPSNGHLTNAQTIRNFAISLNDELDTSKIGRQDGSDDDIILLDTPTNHSEVSVTNDAFALPVTHSTSFLSDVDRSFVPPSPSTTHFDTVPMAVPDIAFPNYPTNEKQFNTIKVWGSDRTIVTLLHHYAEWSIKYPRRTGGLKLLVEAVQRRAQEIGAAVPQHQTIKSRICAIRKKVRDKQKKDEEEAQQKLQSEQIVPIPQHEQIQQQPSTYQTPTDWRNSPTDDEDEIEILGCYERETTNTTTEEVGEINEQNSDDNNIITTNGELMHSTNDENNEENAEKESHEENTVVDVAEETVAQSKDQLEEGIEVGTVANEEMAQNVPEEPMASVQLAKRSKPFNQRIVENIGWRKEFGRVPPKERDSLGLIECIDGATVGCNQRLLASLKSSNPSLFLRTDKFRSRNACGNKKSEVSLQVNEFDEFYKRWISNYEQEGAGKSHGEENSEHDGKEESENGDEEEEPPQISRGPVIKCPRMPKIRINLKRRISTIASEEAKE